MLFDVAEILSCGEPLLDATRNNAQMTKTVESLFPCLPMTLCRHAALAVLRVRCARRQKPLQLHAILFFLSNNLFLCYFYDCYKTQYRKRIHIKM